MIFAGCSFTWGQGLYYYSNLPTLKEPPPDCYDSKLLTPAHIKYMESVRFPRIVADHFNSFEFVYPGNGGSNEGAIEWWEKCFTQVKGSPERHNAYPVPDIKYEEISYVVFQLTQWQREHFILQTEEERHDIAFHQVWEPPMSDIFLKYLDSKQTTLEIWLEDYKNKGLQNVKRFLMDCEAKGIKTLLLTWPPEYIEMIEKDEWLKERFIKISYGGRMYSSIQDLMEHDGHNQNHKGKLTIKWDVENFSETPKDHHPSLKCHQVMAENIIKRIEKDSNK
jgi:hypothetical protein